MGSIITSIRQYLCIDLHWRSTTIHICGFEFYYRTDKVWRQRIAVDRPTKGEVIIHLPCIELYLTNHHRAGTSFAL